MGTHNRNEEAARLEAEPSARSWPDGSPRSVGNGFTHGVLGTPHGYAPGGEVAATPIRRKRGPRSEVAFGVVGGTMLGMGNEAGPIPRMKRAPSHNMKKAA